ncbi:MAG: sodium/proline symporter [Clostridia bacterium]|nr:sodium/proline symporter [Clostridia bacterium]
MKVAVLIAYVCILVGIGYVSMKKTRTVNDFFLGSRTIGPWVSAFAYGTTYFSAVLFIGYAGKVGWGFGLSSLWIVLGNAFVGAYLAWKVLAAPTRRLTTRLGVLTMPAFFEARYDSRWLKIVSALIIFIFLVPYSASVYMGLSYLFEEVFKIPFETALILMAVLTAVYLIMGGYFAVAMTDFVQGFVMIAGVILMIIFIVYDPHVGGVAEGLSRLAQYDSRLVKPIGPPGLVPLLSMVVLTSLGSWGLPQMVQKFYAIKNQESISRAKIVCTVFSFLIALGAYFTGSLSRLFFNNEMPMVGGQPNPDVIMPQIVSRVLPESLGIIILLMVMAASMSTLASLVLVSSSAVAIDLVKETFYPGISRKNVVLLMRILCLVFVGLSLWIALRKPTVILALMSLSWGAVAGSFLAPYLYGLFWKGVTKAGAWSGIISGLGISLGLSLYFKMNESLIPTLGALAIVVPLAVVPLVSLVTRKYPEAFLQKIYGSEPVSTSSNVMYEGVVSQK